MGKVGPNAWTNDRTSLVTDLIRSEDKTTNHSDPKRSQTCVILVNCIDLLMAQCRWYQEMMTQTNAQILTGLQQVVELLPKFLASLSQQTNVPLSPQLHNSLPHPESDRHKMPPWTTAKNSLSLMPKQDANKAMNLVLNINQLQHQKCINYQTSDLFCLPLKHVCFKTFKTTALGNQGPTMFWPKEDMRPP